MGCWGHGFCRGGVAPVPTGRAPEMQTPLQAHTLADSTPPQWRRLFHIGACSAIPVLAIFTSATVMIVLLAVLSGVALSVETARLALPRLNRLLVSWLKPLLKETEGRRLTGATYIAFSALAAFLLFDKPVAITALFFLSLGDPAAALVGSRMARGRVFGKSPWGTFAFLTVGLAVAGVLSAGGVVPLHWGLAVGAGVAAIVELTTLVLDDNLTIPLISGAAMWLMGV